MGCPRTQNSNRLIKIMFSMCQCDSRFFAIVISLQTLLIYVRLVKTDLSTYYLLENLKD